MNPIREPAQRSTSLSRCITVIPLKASCLLARRFAILKRALLLSQDRSWVLPSHEGARSRLLKVTFCNKKEDERSDRAQTETCINPRNFKSSLLILVLLMSFMRSRTLSSPHHRLPLSSSRLICFTHYYQCFFYVLCNLSCFKRTIKGWGSIV